MAVTRGADGIYRGKFPLDEMCDKLRSYTDGNLMKANARKASDRYGVREEHAAGYIRLEKEARGLVPVTLGETSGR